MIEVINASSNAVTAALFEGVPIKTGEMGKASLISSQFLQQLEELIKIIKTTEAHFIRCVKPNEEKKPLCFDNAKTLIQLHSLSILEALQLKNLGFSYRRKFNDFLLQFRFADTSVVDPAVVEHSVLDDPKRSDAEKEKMVNDKVTAAAAAAKSMLERSRIDPKSWRIGKTMIFMTTDGVKTLQDLQRTMTTSWEPLVNTIKCMWMRRQLKMKLNTGSRQLVRVQAHCKRVLQQSRKGVKA